MPEEIRTLDSIADERSHILAKRKRLEEQRNKIDDEIGDLNMKLTHLDIQEKRLQQLPEKS